MTKIELHTVHNAQLVHLFTVFYIQHCSSFYDCEQSPKETVKFDGTYTIQLQWGAKNASVPLVTAQRPRPFAPHRHWHHPPLSSRQHFGLAHN